MQPVRIGMNAAVVLLVLLLSVPLQLLLSSSLSSSPSVEQGDNSGDVTGPRAEAVEQLMDTAESLFDTVHSTIMYYSTWNHLKELVLVPYRKTPRTNLKSTVFKSKAGTTTILISSMDDTKTKKKRSTSASATAGSTSASKTSSSTRSSVSTQAGKMGSNSGTQREAIVKQQFHKSKSGSQQNSPNTETEKVQTGSKMKTSTKTEESDSKSQVIEEVSRAKEVDEYLMNEVYFGQSKKPRDLSVKFSVGRIVRHKTANYEGVVIGWDEVAKAPDKWIRHYYGNRKGVELTTHYLVLVDSKYIASGTPYYYVPQEDLEFGALQQLRCPEVSEFFERFQNGRYVPKPWLRDRYPMD
ncbi:F-box only protein 21 [Geodia barretti]|uniref:F-box only protein 21 n=1 Tax=Geodia barretti TaxID=519541 RepID=A0AA35TIJ0_GEOBA|nr:F-box only protein 21 [Geodia barretti]